MDRGHESDYKKVVLNFSKYISGRKKFKMAEYRIFWVKQVNLGNDAIFLFSHYLYFSKPIFSCSLCKTDYGELYLALLKNNRVKKKFDPKWVTQAWRPVISQTYLVFQIKVWSSYFYVIRFATLSYKIMKRFLKNFAPLLKKSIFFDISDKKLKNVLVFANFYDQ